MTKIFWNGKRDYKLERNYKGQFRTLWSDFKKWAKRLMWFSVISGMAFIAGGVFTPRTIATPVLYDNLAPKIEELKDQVVEDIRNCERSNYSEKDAPVILDTNNKMSFGTFMYQKTTVIHYYKTLYGKKITPKEAVLVTLDEEKARELTYDIIFKDSKGWRNWYNCGVKMGIEGKLKVISELSK